MEISQVQLNFFSTKLVHYSSVLTLRKIHYLSNPINNIQLSPEEEVNSGGYIPRHKGRGIYSPLFTDLEGDSCFSIYQIRWINKCCFNFFFWNFRETTRNFSLRSQNSEYPRIFQVTGANQNTRKLLSTDSVNTNDNYNNENNKSNEMYTVNKKNKLNCIASFFVLFQTFTVS